MDFYRHFGRGFLNQNMLNVTSSHLRELRTAKLRHCAEPCFCCRITVKTQAVAGSRAECAIQPVLQITSTK
jgi:hypothetical protein